MFSKEIKDCLSDLKNLYHATALKASFEDEGINDEDLTDLVLLSRFGDLEVAVKIGGAEANSDILLSVKGCFSLTSKIRLRSSVLQNA